MFIVSISYRVELSAVDAHIPEHVAFLEKYYASGHFIASGRKEPRTGGVIIANAESRQVIEQILAEDPFAKAGIADYDITEFLPTKMAEGFERFMKE
ncbi:YciI family protein [Eionea flava]